MQFSFKKAIKVVVLVLAILSLVFEQSPANEALRAIIGFEVLYLTNNPYIVGFVVALVTFGIEATSSTLISLGLNKSDRFRGIATKFSSKKTGRSQTSTSKLSDYVLALGLGAGILVIKKRIQNTMRTFYQDINIGLKASLAIALFSGTIGFLASGGVELAKNIGLEVQVQYFLDVMTDWRFWLATVVVTQVFEFLSIRVKMFLTNHR